MPENSNNVKVETKGGGLFLVDPNPSGRNVVPAEDMFIYVKLTATERSRGVVTLGQNDNEFDESRFGEINFIATEVKYDTSGQPQKDIMGDVKSYATTNYTQIGGIQNSFGSGLLEGFGITSINIKYNTSLVPQVDIEFTDLRGSGLFDVIEQDNRKSPYSIFFKMPYPVFSLTIKGYFGKPVEYCLNMVNWTSKFDPGTGNFNISANFVGFQQAFLADLTLGDIIGGVNTDEGSQNLSKIPLTVGTIDSNDTTTTSNIPTPALDEFIKKISKLQLDLEKFKADDETYKELTIINTQQKKLEDIRDFIGRPIRKDNSDTNVSEQSIPYSKQLNDPDNISTSDIKNVNLTKFKNYLSIRDILFFKTPVRNEVDIYMQDLYDKLEDYKTFYIENKSKLDNNDKIVDGDTLNAEVFPFSSDDVSEYINYDQLIISKRLSGTDSNGNIELEDFIDELRGSNSILKSNNPKTLESVNNNFSVSAITLTQFSKDDEVNGARGNKNSEFNNTTQGFALDFRAMRMWINDMLIILKEKKELIEKEVVDELNVKLAKELGFVPTIGTVFEILCNNAQAFIQTVYGVAKKAENRQKLRQKALQKTNVQSDLETKEKNDFSSQTIYAFPSVFIEENGGFVEKYLGSEDVFEETDNDSRFAFPEIDFIENIILSITEKEPKVQKVTNQLSKNNINNSTLDTNNWIPINPVDFKTNPFLYLNTNNASSGDLVLKNNFIKILLERYAVLSNYSNFKNIKSYAKWDALLANKSLVDSRVRNFLYTFLQETSDITTNLKKYYSNLNDDNTITPNQISDVSNGPTAILLGIASPGEQYIVIGESNLGKNILNNNITIPKKVLDTNDYKSQFIDKKVVKKSKEDYRYWSTYNFNFYMNQSYECWFNKVSKKLKSNQQVTSTFEVYNNDITLIDGGINPQNNPGATTPTPTEWINIYSNNNNGGNIELETYLTDTDYYNSQTETAKALLLLSTLPFDVFGKLSLPKTASILTLPKHFLLFIGGTLWREIQDNDPINFTNYSGNSTTPNQKEYLEPTFLKRKVRKSIEDSLLNLPKPTKQSIVSYFTNWVNSSEYTNFKDTIIKYSKEENIEKKFNNGTSLANILGESVELIVLAPQVFNLTPNEKIKLSVDGFETYFNNFKNSFKGTLEDTDEETVNQNTLNPKTKNLESVKQSAYNTIKNVYDRWIAGSTDGDIAYNACGTPGKNLFDYFRFIDRGFNDIGNKAIINLQSVISTSNDMSTNLYFYMSNLLRHSNFLFQIMPNYINYKDPDEVSDMFKPITNVSDRNTSSGPTYLCIYAGGTSQVLDIDEKSRYTFKNDGFNFDLPPTDIATKKTATDGEDFNLVAFRVAFGAENQTVFKSVSLNQQEHKDTSEYFATLTDLIDKRGGTNRSYQGTDLYKIFRARSYTCNVEALGCMNIQPMMYFQLDNVPFFEGAYMILNVTHNITPNHMTTSFTGVRQSKYITPVVDKMTTFLNVGLDESIDSEPINEQSLVVREINYNTGIPQDKLPDNPFLFEQLDEGTMIDLGVNNIIGGSYTDLINSLKTLSNTEINTNSQFTMFLANCLTSSNNFSKSVEVWVDKNSAEGFTDYVEPNNRLGNRDLNDAYTFRKRGFIPIVGRDQYLRFSNDTNTPLSQLTGDTISIKNAVKISEWRWLNYPYSNSYNNIEKIKELNKTIEILTKNLESPILTPNEKTKVEEAIKRRNEKIEELNELLLKQDEFLQSAGNYPPVVYGDGGYANNFYQTLSLLTFKEGSNIDVGFDNFAKILRTFSNKLNDTEGENSLLGITTSGKKENKNKGVLYQFNSNTPAENAEKIITNINLSVPTPIETTNANLSN